MGVLCKGTTKKGERGALGTKDAGPPPLPLNGFPSALPFFYLPYPRSTLPGLILFCFGAGLYDFQRLAVNQNGLGGFWFCSRKTRAHNVRTYNY